MAQHVKQLPRTGHGDRLCRHTTPGGCTWWCSYGRFVKVCVLMFLVVGGFAMLSLTLDVDGGQDRLRGAGYALGIYTVVVLTMILIAHRRDDGDHY